MVGSQSSYKQEMFSTASAVFGKEFLRYTKTLLAGEPTIQRHLSELDHANSRSNVDCIWERSQTVGKSCNNGHVMKQAEIFDNLTNWNVHQVNSNSPYPVLSTFWLETVMENLRRLNTAAL